MAHDKALEPRAMGWVLDRHARTLDGKSLGLIFSRDPGGSKREFANYGDMPADP